MLGELKLVKTLTTEEQVLFELSERMLARIGQQEKVDEILLAKSFYNVMRGPLSKGYLRKKIRHQRGRGAV